MSRLCPKHDGRITARSHRRPRLSPQTSARARPARPADEDERIADAAREIVAAVRTGGDAALRRYASGSTAAPTIGALGVDRSEWAAALARLDPDLRAALEFARDQIVAWHEAQREKEARHERSGVRVRELVVPVDRAGCYVPGGARRSRRRC